MIKTKKDKELFVNTLKQRVAEAKNFVLCDYQGITVSEFERLRKELNKIRASGQVIKNSFFKKATNDYNINLDEYFKGPTFLVLQRDDNISELAKVIFSFSKETGKLKVKAGFSGNKLLDKEMFLSIAKLPAKNILLAEVVLRVRMPLQKLVSTLSNPIRDLAFVLKQIKKAENRE